MKILSRFLSPLLFFTVVMTTRVEARVIAELVVDGLSAPLYATSPPGDSRLFVVEKGGTIRIVNPVSGIVLPIPFLTIPGLTTDSERVCWGLPFILTTTSTDFSLFISPTRQGTPRYVATPYRPMKMWPIPRVRF